MSFHTLGIIVNSNYNNNNFQIKHVEAVCAAEWLSKTEFTFVEFVISCVIVPMIPGT